MEIEIPKTNEDLSNNPCWIDTYDTQNNRVRPHIKCMCGANTNIGNHHIHADGTITASYFHNPGCGWHVFLKMKDWDGGELLPGQEKINKS